MKKGQFVFFFFLAFFIFSFDAKAQTAEIYGPQINPETGFNTLQEPFSNFLDSALNINVSGSSRPWFVITSPEEARKSWNQANHWLKEKTGLDILAFLKVIGNILVFVINVSISALGAVAQFVQWLLSLIPGTTP
ncbi:MAG: hypothetical protein AAB903_01565 [Patescibacteria group bacterium]